MRLFFYCFCTLSAYKGGHNVVIICNVTIPKMETHQLHIRCPKCHYRLCDTNIDNKSKKLITIESFSRFDLSIKCHRCGSIVGIKIE